MARAPVSSARITRLEKSVVDIGKSVNDQSHALELHLQECGAQNRVTAESLTQLKDAQDNFAEKLEELNSNAWKIVATVALVVFTAVVGVEVTRIMQRPEPISQQEFIQLHNELNAIAQEQQHQAHPQQ